MDQGYFKIILKDFKNSFENGLNPSWQKHIFHMIMIFNQLFAIVLNLMLDSINGH